MKEVLFVPGSGETMDSRNYEAVFEGMRSRGYKAAFVPINWEDSATINDWSAELMTTYKNRDPSATVLAGFSYGAMAACSVAAQRPPAELWLCSLSPYYAEDLPDQRPAHVSEARMAAFRKHAFSELAGSVTCRTLLFMGEEESPLLQSRVTSAAATLPSATLISVPGCSHDVADPRYINAIASAI